MHIMPRYTGILFLLATILSGLYIVFVYSRFIAIYKEFHDEQEYQNTQLRYLKELHENPIRPSPEINIYKGKG